MIKLFLHLQIAKKNAEIKRLKSSIKGVVNLAEDRNRRVKVDAHNQQMQDKQNHDTKVRELREDIATLNKKLQDMTAENRDKEQSLRKVWVTCGALVKPLYNGHLQCRFLCNISKRITFQLLADVHKIVKKTSGHFVEGV